MPKTNRAPLPSSNRSVSGRIHHDVETIVSLIFEQIAAALARGDRVELRGFGSFSVKHRGPRVGRNPRTGASVTVDDKCVPFFRAGKPLHNRLNQPD